MVVNDCGSYDHDDTEGWIEEDRRLYHGIGDIQENTTVSDLRRVELTEGMFGLYIRVERSNGMHRFVVGYDHLPGLLTYLIGKNEGGQDDDFILLLREILARVRQREEV